MRCKFGAEYGSLTLMTSSTIETVGLSRKFVTPDGPVNAVSGIDFAVETGQIVGFLGQNGAGKTTTVRMLTTLLPPTSGHAVVAGYDLRRYPDGVRSRIGYVAQSGGLDPAVSVHEELITQARLHRLPPKAARERASEMASALGLRDLLTRPTGALSGGQSRRVEIALGMINLPQVLFLDEPTTGLDPGSRGELWDLVRRVRDDHGTTVFLTTHYLEEADALADRIVVIDDGQIVADGSPAKLKKQATGDSNASLQDAFLAITGRLSGAGRDSIP